LPAQGRPDEISEYLNYFKAYPAHDPDYLAKLIDLLALADASAALFDLVEATANPISLSPEVIGSEFVMDWLIFRRWIPYLDRQFFSEVDPRELFDDLTALNPPVRLNLQKISERLNGYAAPPILRDLPFRRRSKVVGFYLRVSCHFCAWLHARKDMGWVCGRFLSNQLANYLLDFPEDKIPKKPFGFSEERLVRHINKECEWIFSIQGVQAFALLNAVYLFTEYLREADYHDQSESDRIRSTCMKLFEHFKGVVEPNDPALRLYADFPNLRTAPFRLLPAEVHREAESEQRHSARSLTGDGSPQG